MNTFLILLGILVGLIILGVILVVLLTPWMDRWGTSQEEIAATYPGDELVATPASFVNRAITIDARPEQIYPWLVQLGAGKGGFYTYTSLEKFIGCPLVNADSIHDEWQNLQVGDEVKMCPKDPAPPPYIVAQIHPNRAIVLGHKDKDEWVDLWQFILVPRSDGTTRLVLRTRTMMVGGFWNIIHPGVFIMEYGMLNGIKTRAEKLVQQE
jgi:hypothetical protein